MVPVLYHAYVLLLAWLTEGARLFANLPYAAMHPPTFPLWLLLGCYTIVVGGWLWHAGLQEYHPALKIGETFSHAPEQIT